MKYKYQDAFTNGWKDGAHLINDTMGALGKTLQQLYNSQSVKNEDVGYALYNDQPPSEGNNSASYGHTKGVVLLDKEQGFWLIHSTPHFPPPVNQRYSWPKNGIRNGQSFLCVTYPFSQFNTIGKQLQFNHPLFFNQFIPESFESDLPDLVKAVKDKIPTSSSWTQQVTLTSAQGKNFVSFSKYGRFGDDLYSGFVAQALKRSLLVEFWPNSQGVLSSNCSMKYHVLNINNVTFAGGLHFHSQHDHSKWCVSESLTGEEQWTCIGDMNRNKGEQKRGGGTVCTSDPVVWKSYRALVGGWEPCND
ncbi:deoxyribonuclease-2-alpha isoform X2 [Latimeria chalumnae]